MQYECVCSVWVCVQCMCACMRVYVCVLCMSVCGVCMCVNVSVVKLSLLLEQTRVIRGAAILSCQVMTILTS